MKIFQIGFNKCGTVSLYNLFKDHTIDSLKCVHWDAGNLAKTINHNIKNNICPILGQYDHFNFISDMEHSDDKEIILAHKNYFMQLDREYPNSRFIFNIRPIDKWIISRLNHESNLVPSYVEKYQKVYDISFIDTINLWRHQLLDHLYNVKSYFKNRNNLLIYDIENDPFNKLTNFFYDIKFTVNCLPKNNKTC